MVKDAKPDFFIFELTTPVKAQGDTEFVNYTQLYLKAPNYKHREKTLILKKLFIEAIFGMTKHLNQDEAQEKMDNIDDGEDDSMSAKAIIGTLYASKGFDIADFYNRFSKFLLAEICFLGDTDAKPIYKSALEKVSEEDYEQLIAKYLEFFFVTSWMKTLK